ncbi:hypothetical protein [Labrys neptuniae]
MSKKATPDTLAALHSALAEHLTDVLNNGEEKITKEGELVRIKPQAATLNVIRQFLKDNDTDAMPGANAGMNALAQAAARHLPFPRPTEDEQGLPQ